MSKPRRTQPELKIELDPKTIKNAIEYFRDRGYDSIADMLQREAERVGVDLEKGYDE